jgi:hypothetical protein
MVNPFWGHLRAMGTIDPEPRIPPPLRSQCGQPRESIGNAEVRLTIRQARAWKKMIAPRARFAVIDQFRVC